MVLNTRHIGRWWRENHPQPLPSPSALNPIPLSMSKQQKQNYKKDKHIEYKKSTLSPPAVSQSYISNPKFKIQNPKFKFKKTYKIPKRYKIQKRHKIEKTKPKSSFSSPAIIPIPYVRSKSKIQIQEGTRNMYRKDKKMKIQNPYPNPYPNPNPISPIQIQNSRSGKDIKYRKDTK